MDSSSSKSSFVILGPRFEKALRLAVSLHRHDTRKGKQTPYIAHLLGVCELVLQDGGTEDEAIAALLHDALEDHPEEVSPKEIRKQFGETVLEIVRSCTDTPVNFRGGPKPPWKQRKLAYVDHIVHATAGARRVTLADKLYNARDILFDVHKDGDRTWARFNAGRKEQIWYYRAIRQRMRRAGQRGLLMEQFTRVVDELVAMKTGTGKRKLRLIAPPRRSPPSRSARPARARRPFPD